MKKLCVLLLLSAAMIGFAAGPVFFEDIRIPGINIKYFIPDKVDGFYSLGEPVKLKMKIGSTLTSGKLHISFSESDYFAKKLGTVLRKELSLTKGDTIHEFTLPARKKYGYYTVTAAFQYNGKNVGYTQSAYMILPPKQKKLDPYFMPDKNGMTEVFAESMKRMGFGGRFIYMPGASQAINSKVATLEKIYARQGARCRQYKEYGVVYGAASPDVKMTRRVQRRLSESLAPVSDEDLLKVRRHYERLARETRDSLKYWVIQEEFDAIFAIPSCRDDQLHHISTYALIAKNIYLGLKKGNPDCQVGVLGICCSDYFNAPTPFLFSRLVLKALHKHYDFVVLDAYSGNWNRGNGEFALPEKGLRRLLIDGAKLSAECGGQKKVGNVERCFAIYYGSAFDSEFGRQQADVTARSMVINRSVKEAICYSLHLPAYVSSARRALQRKRMRTADMSVWKTVFTDDKLTKPAYIPRSMALAAGTTARELSFCTNPAEIILPGGIYAYIFDAPGKKTLVSLWVTGRDLDAELSFPGEYILTDITGNSIRSRGKKKLVLTTTPVFFRCSGDRKAVETAVRKMKYNSASLLKSRVFALDSKTLGIAVTNSGSVKGLCKVTLNGRSKSIQLPANGTGYLKWKAEKADSLTLAFRGHTVSHMIRMSQIRIPAKKAQSKINQLQLRVPAHVDPPSALMPEYGIVKAGPDAPYADVRFAWDKAGLEITAVVGNKEHIQRKKGGKIQEDDSLVIEFNHFDNMMRNPKQKTPRIMFAKTASGSEAVYTDIWNVNRPAGKCSVTVNGNVTVYRAVIPWKLIPGFRGAARGKTLLYHVYCPMVARPLDSKALYVLASGRKDKHFITYCNAAVLQ